jgi:hypothetical protein
MHHIASKYGIPRHNVKCKTPYDSSCSHIWHTCPCGCCYPWRYEVHNSFEESVHQDTCLLSSVAALAHALRSPTKVRGSASTPPSSNAFCPCPHFTCPKKIHHTPRNNIMHAPHTLLETLKASLMLTIWHRCQRGYNLQAYKTQTHFQSFVHGHACPLQVVIQWQHRQSVHPQKQQVLTPPLEIASVEIVSMPCVHTHPSLVQESWSSK